MYENTQNYIFTYKDTVKQLWLEVSMLRRMYMQNLTAGRMDADVVLAYLNALGSLWFELSPFIEGSSSQSVGGITEEFENKFMSFEEYSKNPIMFMQKPTAVSEMEDILIKAVKRLNIITLGA